MRIQLPSGTTAEFVEPPGEALRGLVIAPDIGGLRPLFDDLAGRLAAEQRWAVVAVEPFPTGQPASIEERLATRIDVDRITSDLVAGADELTTRTTVARVGVLGFCMGGMNAFRAAGTGRFDAAVAFYGMLRPPEQWSSPGNDPLDALARPDAAPVLAIFGGVDRWTPAADIEAFEALGADRTARVYAEGDHGFVHDPSRPAHRADDAADAWRWVTEFLA